MSSSPSLLLDEIYRRRSIRQYTSQTLTPEQVQSLLEAGLRAPSSRNKHSTQFVLVEDRETLDKLSYMRERGAGFLREVPLAIVILGSPMECDYWISDATLAAAFIQLQAEHLGLGTCWADARGKLTPSGQDSDEYVRQVLDIPYQLEVVCILAVGHKGGEAPARPTETLRWEQIHLGRYQLREDVELETQQ